MDERDIKYDKARFYEAKPKNGRLTERHKTELKKAGFFWTGLGWIATAEKRPVVWGCTVRSIKPPKRKPVRTEQEFYKWLKEVFGF